MCMFVHMCMMCMCVYRLPHALQVLCVQEVRGLEVNAVVHRADFYGVLPAARGLVQRIV
jgi:hypothetical protein